MDITGYINILRNSKYLNYDLGFQATNILREFSYNQYRSTWQIYSHFKNSIFQMAYKNIHKRVKKLESLEFIEPVKVEDAKYGAKYYRISEAGMFELFLQKTPLEIYSLLPLIVETHEDYSIFETLLHPYFKKETLLSLKEDRDNVNKAIMQVIEKSGTSNVKIDRYYNPSNLIIYAVFLYLKDCCRGITETKGEYDSRIKPTLSLLRFELVMKIFMYFREYKQKRQPDAFTILAQDDKFMELAHDLYNDFEKTFYTTMLSLGKRI